MKFHVIYKGASSNGQSPVRIVEQTTGREVDWINRFLDREYVRRLADTTLRLYAHELLHFLRWWESVHHTGDIADNDLSESTLLEYVRFQSGQQPRPSPPPSTTAPPSSTVWSNLHNSQQLLRIAHWKWAEEQRIHNAEKHTTSANT